MRSAFEISVRMVGCALLAVMLAGFAGPVLAANHGSAEACKTAHQSCEGRCDTGPSGKLCRSTCRQAYKTCLGHVLDALDHSAVSGH